jgi:hypothetical protein
MSGQMLEGIEVGRIALSTPTSELNDKPAEPQSTINAIDWNMGKKIYHSVVPCFLAFLS